MLIVGATLRDRHFFAQIHILNGIEEFYAVGHGALEGLAAGDEAGAAGALVDDGCGYGFLEVVGSGSAAGIDEAGAAHVAVGHLVAGEIDRVIAGEIRVDALIEFPVAGIADVQRLVAAVIFRELLLDDVSLNSHAEVIGLAGEVGGDVVILVLFERGIAQVAPQYGSHAEFVGLGEGMADFDDLAVGILGAEIDSGAHRGSTHVVGFLHGAEQNLVELIGVGEEFVVIDLHDEGNLVGVFPRNRA